MQPGADAARSGNRKSNRGPNSRAALRLRNYIGAHQKETMGGTA
jgi:hypothetical protein